MNHIPVLLKETIEYLNVSKGKKFVDATVGSGGHTREILKANPSARVLGIDLDQASLDKLKVELVQEGLSQRVKLVHGNYRNIESIVEQVGWEKVDGIILDLGFSSLQLDDPARGFSFQQKAVLDMRFDQSASLTAQEVVNRYQPKDLEKVLFKFGEEKFARKITSAIVAERKLGPIQTTSQLAEIVRLAIPAPIRFKSKDNIRRVFQAIRIEVNAELENLKIGLPKMLQLLNENGRLAVISFHSLEDRIVKNFFVEESKGCVCPVEFPTCVCDKVSSLRILTRKPIIATQEEIALNPRSKSAKLRAVEKV